MQQTKSASAPKNGGWLSAWDRGLDRTIVVLFPVLLLLAVTIQNTVMSMILAVVAVVLGIGASPARNLQQRLCIPLLGFFFYALMNLLAAVYAPVGILAVKEAVKFLASSALFSLIILRFRKEQVPALLWSFSGVSAVVALLSVDSGSNGPLFSGFVRLMSALGMDYTGVAGGTAEGTRVNGIYNDGNVTASIFALACLLLLYLAQQKESGLRKRLAAFFLLGINAMGFFLALSRGAILAFCVALLAYLIAARRGARLPLFLLMLETAVCTVMFSAVSMQFLGKSFLLPDVLTLICGLPIFAIDWLLGARLSCLLEGKGKVIVAMTVVLAVVIGAFSAAALTMTDAYTFSEDGTLLRAAQLPAGTYTLDVQWEGAEPGVEVYTQTRMEQLHTTGTTRYSGPASGVSFTVEEDGQVNVRFVGQKGTTLNSAVFSDGTVLKLHYKLLPEFVAARLQDSLSQSYSSWQRWQYDIDGLHLFLNRPLLGYGLGATESWLGSVQPYYYESNYVHNHVLQVMDETGVVGLAGFAALLLGTAWLLLRRLRQEPDALAAALLACWVMMNVHSLMEINFSIRAYQCFAYGILLLTVMQYGQPLTASLQGGKWAGRCASLFLLVYTAVFGWLIFQNYSVNQERQAFSTNSLTAYMNMVEKYISRNVLDPEDLQLTFVAQAMGTSDGTYDAQMLKYVKTLRNSETYIACSNLANLYYLPSGQLEEMFSASLTGIHQIASNANAWNQQMDFYRTEVMNTITAEQAAQVAAGVQMVGDALDAFNVDRLETIELTAENQMFLAAARTVRAENLTGDEAYQLLKAASSMG